MKISNIHNAAEVIDSFCEKKYLKSFSYIVDRRDKKKYWEFVFEHGAFHEIQRVMRIELTSRVITRNFLFMKMCGVLCEAGVFYTMIKNGKIKIGKQGEMWG